MNGKYFGEIGQNVAIGELSKFGIGVAIPLGDNLPFDLIAIVENRLYKLQVKSSSQGKEKESIVFDFSSNDFYAGTTKKYTKQEVDILVGVDLRDYRVYLFDKFEDQYSMTVRLSPPKNGQKKHMNWYEDFILNHLRIKKLFNFDPPETEGWFSKRIATQYSHTCKYCEKKFINGSKNTKHCGYECSQLAQRHVTRPSKDVLKEDMDSLSWRAIGRKYGVSDNATRKWAKSYELL